MGRPNKKGDPSEFDQLMDDVASLEGLGEPEEEKDEAPPVAAVEEPPAEPETPAVEEVPSTERTPTEEPEPEIPAEPEPVEPIAAVEEEPPAAVADGVETPPVITETPPAETPEEADAKRIRGMQSKIAQLRIKNRETAARQAAAAQPQAPQPPPVAPTPAPTQEAGDLDDMIVFEDGVAKIDRSKLSQVIREATAPTPEQMADQAGAHFKSDFVGRAQTPEERVNRTQALAHTEMAFDHFRELLQAKAHEMGFTALPSASFDQTMDFAQQSGALDEIAQDYPDVAPHIPALLGASAMNSQAMMRQAVDGYMVTRAAAPATPAVPRAGAAGGAPLPTTRAPSLADAGTATVEPGQGEQERYASLGKKQLKDPMFGLNAAEYAEYEALEAKFEK